MYLTWTAIESAPRKHQANRLAITGMSGSDYLDNIRSFHQEYYCGPNQDKKTWTDEVLPYINVALMFVMVTYSCIRTSEPDSDESLNYSNRAPKAPEDQRDIEDIGGQKIKRNERYSLVYSYPLFHFMLMLATLYMMMSLTGWYTPDNASLSNFGRSWSAVWIKMGSSWICLCVYLFTVLFPTVLPKKKRIPIVEMIANGHLIDEDEDDVAVPLAKVHRPKTVHQETTV